MRWLGCVVGLGVWGCAGPDLVISPEALPVGAEGMAYSQTLTADAGGPVTWAVDSGSLPPGLTLNPNTGLLSGVPAAPGSFTFRVVATSHVLPLRSGRRTYSVTIIEELILDADMPAARVGESYSHAFVVSGGVGPYLFDVLGLPAGLDFDEASGTVSGVPLNPDPDAPLEVSVEDSGQPRQSVTERTTLEIKPLPVGIATEGLPDGRVGRRYSQQLAAANGLAPFRWAVVAGVLPDGLRLNLLTGVISGTPAAAQSRTFTIRVRDSDSPPTEDEKEFTIDIAE